MFKSFFILLFLSSATLLSQPNTDVFLLDLHHSEDKIKVSGLQNISTNAGYDNQPSFYDTTTVVFAGNNNGQTDIAHYNLSTKQSKWWHPTTSGGEYSPQRIPGSNHIAAVRLDTTGMQRWYEYTENDIVDVLIEELQVAYVAFYNSDVFVAAVLGQKLVLVTGNLKTKKVDTLQTNVGRSIHKVPNTNYMSYTAVNEEGLHEVFLLDMDTVESYFVCQLPIGIQDLVWLSDTQLLIGSRSTLYVYDTLLAPEWNAVADLSANGITEITRLAVNENGTKLALVAEPDIYFKEK